MYRSYNSKNKWQEKVSSPSQEKKTDISTFEDIFNKLIDEISRLQSGDPDTIKGAILRKSSLTKVDTYKLPENMDPIITSRILIDNVYKLLPEQNSSVISKPEVFLLAYQAFISSNKNADIYASMDKKDIGPKKIYIDTDIEVKPEMNIGQLVVAYKQKHSFEYENMKDAFPEHDNMESFRGMISKKAKNGTPFSIADIESFIEKYEFSYEDSKTIISLNKKAYLRKKGVEELDDPTQKLVDSLKEDSINQKEFFYMLAYHNGEAPTSYYTTRLQEKYPVYKQYSTRNLRNFVYGNENPPEKWLEDIAEYAGLRTKHVAILKEKIKTQDRFSRKSLDEEEVSVESINKKIETAHKNFSDNSPNENNNNISDIIACILKRKSSTIQNLVDFIQDYIKEDGLTFTRQSLSSLLNGNQFYIKENKVAEAITKFSDMDEDSSKKFIEISTNKVKVFNNKAFDELKNDFTGNLQKMHQSAKITVREISRNMGLSESTYGVYLSKNGSINPDWVNAVAKELFVPDDKLEEFRKANNEARLRKVASRTQGGISK